MHQPMRPLIAAILLSACTEKEDTGSADSGNTQGGSGMCTINLSADTAMCTTDFESLLITMYDSAGQPLNGGTFYIEPSGIDGYQPVGPYNISGVLTLTNGSTYSQQYQGVCNDAAPVHLVWGCT